MGTLAAALVLLLLEGETTEQSRRTYRMSAPRKTISSIGFNLPSLTKANRFAPVFAGTALVFICSSLYTILLRGCWLFPFVAGQGADLAGATGVYKSHEDVFASVYGFSSRTTDVKAEDDVASMAKKNLFHSKAVVTAAKLAGSGFWTAGHLFGPILHLAGVVSIIPNLYFMLSFMWTGKKQSSTKILAFLPLTFLPLIMCRGIPSLWVGALLSFSGGIIQLSQTRQSEHASHMRI